MTTATITSCKGEFTGTIADCQSWLDEMQPAFASVEIGGIVSSIETTLREAIVELTEDIEGGEPEWQQYLTTEQLAELLAANA